MPKLVEWELNLDTRTTWHSPKTLTNRLADKGLQFVRLELLFQKILQMGYCYCTSLTSIIMNQAKIMTLTEMDKQHQCNYCKLCCYYFSVGKSSVWGKKRVPLTTTFAHWFNLCKSGSSKVSRFNQVLAFKMSDSQYWYSEWVSLGN